MRLAIAIVIVSACGGSSGNSSTTDAGPGTDGRVCGIGDSCNVAANTGCDDDDRCTVVELGMCFFPQCQGSGPEPVGAPCTMNANTEGAEIWDNCGPQLVCFNSVCTRACSMGGTECTAPATCQPDPDVGALVLNICQ